MKNHGVPASVYEIKHNNRSISDELFFNDGVSRYPRQSYSDEHLAYGERYESGGSEESEEDEDSERRRSVSSSTQLVRRDSDQLMAQRALDRIDRAKAKGKGSVNLTHEEIEALEKRFARPSNSNSPERDRRGSGGDKDKSGKGRSPSGSNGAWTRKRGSRRSSIIATSTALAPAKPRNSKKKQPSPPREEPYPTPPGFMATGPGGVPVYAPLGYYNPQPGATGRRTASDGLRYSPPRSGDSSRSTSASSRRAVPYDGPPYPSARSRGPPSPADPELYPGYPPYAYGGPPPPQDGRRVASGPAQVNYSHVYRRVTPTSTSRGRLAPTNSDPSMYHTERGPSGLGNEYEPSSATSSEEDDEDEEDELSRSRDSVYVDERERRRTTAAPAATQTSRARRRR